MVTSPLYDVLGHTNHIFSESSWSQDIKTDITKCLILKYTNTNTQIHKYSIWQSARKTQHVVYFWKEDCSEVSKMIFTCVKRANTKIQLHKYTNTQIHKYGIWQSARKTQHVVYFWKEDCSRIWKMIFPCVKHANTKIQIYKYTNTAYDKVPERPSMWHIFEKRIVQGYQKLYSHVSYTEILVLMHWRWCSDGDALKVMHWRWCTEGDALKVMRWNWCIEDDALKAMHWRGLTEDDALKVMLWRWYTDRSSRGPF